MAAVLAIVGPTAVGKSRLALAVAERCGGEIVSADALQVYRGFDIGTAKPSAEERARVPHHLLDLVDPHEQFTAGRFAAEARAVLDDIAARSRPAILVGGSGLYLRALLDGIAPLPAVEPAVRDELARRLDDEGLPALRAQLQQLDPITARRLGAGDRQRILRALEIVLASGRPLSEWLAERPSGEQPLAARRVGLTLPRALLYDRIESRVRQMIADGWLEEVRRLLAGGADPGGAAFQAIGYAQWAQHLAGAIDFEAATRQIVMATRRYAKRQETWFRRQAGIEWHDSRNIDSLAGRLARELEG